MSTERSRPLPEPVHVLRSRREVTAIHTIDDTSGGHSLVTGHDTGELQLWNLTIYRVKLSWSAHPNHRIQWIGDVDDRIFSYGRDGLIHVWIIQENLPSQVLTLAVNCCTHCPCDLTRFGLLATPLEDAAVSLRDVAAIDSVTIVRATSKRGMIMTIRFVVVLGQNFVFLLVAYEDGCLTSYRTTNGSEVSCLQLSSPSTMDEGTPAITCLDFHNATMRGISGSPGDRLNVFEVSDLGELGLKTSVAITNPGVACVRVRPDGKYCVAGGWDHRIRVFSWKTLKLLAVIELHSDTVQCLTFVRRPSESEVLLVAGSRDGRMSLWNLYNDKKSVSVKNV